MEDGATVEVNMVGSEGVVGMSAILGGGISSHWTRVQIAGNAVRMKTAVLKELASKTEEAREEEGSGEPTSDRPIRASPRRFCSM